MHMKGVTRSRLRARSLAKVNRIKWGMEGRIKCILATTNGRTRLAFYDTQTSEIVSCFTVTDLISWTSAPRSWTLEEIEGELLEAREREK